MNNTMTKSIAALAIAAMILPTGCRGSPRSSSLTQDQDDSYKTGFQVGSYINESAAEESDASVTCNLLARSRNPETNKDRYINGCVDALRQHGAK
jgi:hypothetical protein